MERERRVFDSVCVWKWKARISDIWIFVTDFVAFLETLLSKLSFFAH